MNPQSIMKMIKDALRPIERRVMATVGRAVLSATSKDGSEIQTAQLNLLAGETKDDVERFQNYGFTSVPHVGAEAVVVFGSGSRDQGMIIAVDDRRYRLKNLEAGEVALYTDEGDKIHLKRDNQIEIKTKKLAIDCEDATVNATASAKIESPKIDLGAAAADAVIKGNTFQALFNSHIHVGNLGYNTSPPTVPLNGSELSTISKVE